MIQGTVPAPAAIIGATRVVSVVAGIAIGRYMQKKARVKGKVMLIEVVAKKRERERGKETRRVRERERERRVTRSKFMKGTKLLSLFHFFQR